MIGQATGHMSSTPTKRIISPDEAKAERARRELAKRRYRDFRNYMAPWYINAPHNLLLAEYLEKVELFIRTDGQEGIGRLMVFMPPRYGKSEDVARFFPTWVLGRNPDKRVAIISYASNLSDGHSRQIRNYMMDRRFSNIFGKTSTIDTPVEISDDSASKSDWDLAEPHRGGCVSRGIGGGLSGKGAHLLIIDDPTKDAEEAMSEIHQRRVMAWYQSVGVQRLEKGSAVIIIQTRWNPNDLPGQLLQAMGSDDPDAEQWEIVMLPALALQENEYPKTDLEAKENLIRGIFIPKEDMLKRKPGTALWPWKFPQEVVEAKKSKVSPFFFAAFDQQLPRAFSGGVFDEKDIRIIEPSQIPEGLTWCAYIDLALGNSKASDLNAAMPMTLFPETGDIVGRDLIHERELGKFLKMVRIAMLMPENKHVIWGVESTAFQTLVFQDFMKDIGLTTVAIVKIIPQESKQDRAMKVSLRAKEQHFCLVRGSWVPAAKRELLEFPLGHMTTLWIRSAAGNT